ncbi:MAG: GxxExxY protein [Lewinella sp.]|nr:GxxExxY protein [Lewinella sp.]
MHENEIVTMILDEAFAVHRYYGPGIFERVYEAALEARLKRRGLAVLRQKTILINDEFVRNEPGFVLDLLVEGKVIIELKSVEKVKKKHKKQLLTYLRLTERRLGLLLNFHEDRLKDGLWRIANGLTDSDHPPFEPM